MRSLALKAACQLGAYLQASDEEIEVYAYSTEIILVQTVQTSVYIAIAAATGYLLPALLVMTGFSGFRFLAGGPHLNTFLRCLIFSGLTIAVLVVVSLPAWPNYLRYTSEVIMVFTTLYVTYKWVPAGTEKKTMHDPVLRRRQKTKTLVFIIVLSALLVLLEIKHQDLIIQALLAGVIGSALFIFPWGYKIMLSCDTLLDKARYTGP
ncbi:MAG: accessory gene regulator B family protein [Syntrophomonadaceae bacterium]